MTCSSESFFVLPFIVLIELFFTHFKIIFIVFLTCFKMNFKTILICITLVAGHISFVSSANILVYVVLGGYSHRLSMWAFVEELANKGHNVTFISSYPCKPANCHPKIHDIVPKLWQKRMGDWSEHMNFYELRAADKIVDVWTSLPDFAKNSCEALYEDDEFVAWMRTASFDLVIFDILMNECAYGMAHLWKAKIIAYSTANTVGWFHDSYGLPDETSSVTDSIYRWQHGPQMSFKERFVNAMTPLYWKYVREQQMFPALEEISRRGLKKVTGKDVDLPPFAEIERNISLLMLSSHYSMSFTRSLPPNVVEVGGATISKTVKPLEKEFEDFIGNGDFMYVSLGSVVEFTQIPPEGQKEFIGALEAFPKLKFIWKSNKEITAPLPKNVKVVKWAPQTSLLAHPKMKGFITHAGLGSTTESIEHGVPAILFPVFAEQDMNTELVASRGAGIRLEITELQKAVFENAIREILENPKYRKGMERLSKLFKDRPMPPIKTALWWTEFVLRHDNTNEFLQPPSVQQAWWVKRQIDVWVVAALLLLMIVTLPLYITYKIAQKILCLSKGSSPSSLQHKNGVSSKKWKNGKKYD